MKTSLKKLLFVVLSALMIAVPAFPQASSGILTGRVTDSSEAVIPGVSISISSPAMIGGARDDITNERGVYRFTLLPPGEYRLQFELTGFKTVIRERVIVRVGGTTTINVPLDVAAVAETLTVTGESPTIDLEAATVGVNYDTQLMQNLPSARNFTSMFAQIPGVLTRAYDVGGSTMGTGTWGGNFSTYGKQGGKYVVVDGIVAEGHYDDFGAYQEVQFVGAAKGAEAPTPGAYINAVIKSGGNDLHATIYADWQDRRFQGSNVTDELRRRGLRSGQQFVRYNDFNFDIGGPIMRDRFWFYVSHRDWYSGFKEPGFVHKDGRPATASTLIRDPTVKLTYQLTDVQKLDFTVQFGLKYQPYRHTFSDAAFIPADSARRQESWSAIGKLGWQAILSAKTTIEAQLSRWGWWWPSTSWLNEISERDLTTRLVRGGYSGQGGGSSQGVPTYSRPIRWQWNATVNHFLNTANAGNHEVKVGYIGWHYTDLTEDRGTVNHQIYYYRDNFTRPDYVRVYDTPTRFIDGQRHHGFFINDRWKITPKLTANLGVRFDNYSAFYPEQGNSGTGLWATRTVIPARELNRFNNWVPRLSFIYDVTGTGRTAFKASYGRYYDDPSVDISGAANPSATQRWRYRWDGSIPYIPKPQDLLAQEAGSSDRAVDPNLKNSYTDEWVAGYEMQVSTDYSVRMDVVRKFDKNAAQTVNVALPFGAYTLSSVAVDPGRDNVTGTADDRQLVIWAVPRSHPNFGKRVDRLMNVNGASSNYTSVEASLNKRLSNRWQMLIGYNRDFVDVRAEMPTDPNEELYENSRYLWQWGFKALGTYQLPRGFIFSGVFKSQSGSPYGRQLVVRDANGSSLTLDVDRRGDAGFYDKVNLVDLRFSKIFAPNDRHSIEAMFDLFNALNSNTILAQSTQNGLTYLRPTQNLNPRIFRLAVRWKF